MKKLFIWMLALVGLLSSCTDLAPTVDITEPVGGATYQAGDSLNFAGVIEDDERITEVNFRLLNITLGDSVLWDSVVTNPPNPYNFSFPQVLNVAANTSLRYEIDARDNKSQGGLDAASFSTSP